MRSMLASVPFAIIMLGGCASDPETTNLMATLPVATTVGGAHLLAGCIEADLSAQTTIAEADKAELRARAAVLASHAEKLSTAIDMYDPAGKKNTSITLGNLKARGDALEAEYRTAFREWGIWQVRHGIKKPEEVFEVFDFDYFEDDAVAPSHSPR